MVIETGTETTVFLLYRTEPKPRFYASDWRFGLEMEQLWCLER